jgi:clan AA aspartic protease
MGLFNVEIGIGHRDREDWETLDALVDTGASVAAAPASLLRRLGIESRWTQSFTLADGATREMEIGEARVRAGGREVTTLVLFNDEGSPPILGAFALEGLFLGVDPVGQKLVPVGGWLA